MAEINVWLADWEHDCCGDFRKVGDTITVDLSFSGNVEPTTELNQIATLGDGRFLLVGETFSSDTPRAGRLVKIGKLHFGFPGTLTSSRVRCEGELWEERHGPQDSPLGSTTGRITGIRFCQAILEQTGPVSSKIIGYEPGSVLNNTDQQSGAGAPSLAWAFMFTLVVD